MTARRSQAGGNALDPAALEAALGYVFANRDLLAQALTHRSALGHRLGASASASNERLEFLGDRVLGIIIAERLLTMFPDEAEGALAPRLAALVSAPALADVATACDLAPYVRIAPGQRADDGDTAVLADACEALIGAIYLDGGLDAARTFVLSRWEDRMRASAAPPKDPKTALQEWAQARGMPLPEYRVVSNEGPSHAPLFIMAVSVTGIAEATGSGRSKRQATSAAAATLLERIASTPQDAAADGEGQKP
ncbi:MAG: ribonuclease III [Rhodospirillaceae bacterium]|nr:MAG: ribonuclease III [Rhodospirillaceae bacterium]